MKVKFILLLISALLLGLMATAASAGPAPLKNRPIPAPWDFQ